MNQVTSSAALPAAHGIERAAARLHQIADGRTPWSALSYAERLRWRAVVTLVQRDLCPEPPPGCGAGCVPRYTDPPTYLLAA